MSGRLQAGQLRVLELGPESGRQRASDDCWPEVSGMVGPWALMGESSGGRAHTPAEDGVPQVAHKYVLHAVQPYSKRSGRVRAAHRAHKGACSEAVILDRMQVAGGLASVGLPWCRAVAGVVGAVSALAC